MLDPKTLTLTPHDPAYYSTMQIPVEWQPDAPADDLLKFLKEVLPEDCIDLVQMMMGYFLIPDISIKSFYVLQGPGNSGKTTLLYLIQTLIGEENFAIVELHELAGNRFAAARLEDKLLGVFDDIKAGHLEDTSIAKVITGGSGFISVERKCQDAYKAPLYAKMLFTCNTMPTAPDKSDAWYNRVCLIPMTTVIKPEKQDHSLKEKLTTGPNLQGLFRFAAEGLKKLIDRKLVYPSPKTVRKALYEYVGRNDTVVSFLTEACAAVPVSQIPRSEFYETYCQWIEMNRLTPVGKHKFFERLTEWGVRIKRDSAGNFVVEGIMILTGATSEIAAYKNNKDKWRAIPRGY